MWKTTIAVMLVACFGLNSKEVCAKTRKHHVSRIEKVGIASWYGGKFIGRKTASGEIFSSKRFTCAHKTFPLGTTLKVHSFDTNKDVIVVVNDRGPYVKNRIIDLSPIAAKTLGMGKKKGLHKVIITPINIPTEYAEYKERRKNK